MTHKNVPRSPWKGLIKTLLTSGLLLFHRHWHHQPVIACGANIAPIYIYMNIDSAVPIIGDVAVILQLFPSSVTIKHGLGYAVNAIQDGCHENGWKSINYWIKLHILHVNKWAEPVYFPVWTRHLLVVGARIRRRADISRPDGGLQVLLLQLRADKRLSPSSRPTKIITPIKNRGDCSQRQRGRRINSQTQTHGIKCCV